MKRILLVVALIVSTSSLFAQTGGLRITVSNCGVWVKLYGVDFAAGDGPCQLSSVTFFLTPGTYTWCSVWDFQGPFVCGTAGYAPGWASGIPIPVTSTSFQWTDVTYQYECPACNGGGNLMNNPAAVAVYFSTCLFPFASPCGPGGTWTPASLPPMGDLTLTF